MIRCLILDRSAIDRAALRHRLSVHPGVQITGEAGTLAEARELLSQMNHDLVFADTHLAGGSALDLVAELGPHARLVLVTASEAHAIRAFEVGVLDYILKPASPERLTLAMSRHAGPNRHKSRRLPRAARWLPTTLSACVAARPYASRRCDRSA